MKGKGGKGGKGPGGKPKPGKPGKPGGGSTVTGASIGGFDPGEEDPEDTETIEEQLRDLAHINTSRKMWLELKGDNLGKFPVFV